MHLLFLHQSFPAQFGRLALELTRRYGFRCDFAVERLATCPAPSREMLERLRILAVPGEPVRGRGLSSWAQNFGHHLAMCARFREELQARPEFWPDLVVSHCDQGPSLFLHDLLSCPIVQYFEYYMPARRGGLTYRVDLPPVPIAPFYSRCINAAALLSRVDAPFGYTPTHWQKQSFPERWRSRIEVYFDGLDTELYRPRPGAAAHLAPLLGGRSLPSGTRLVTFVARGLEPVRGFDLFLRVAGRICRARSDVLFLVAGGEDSYYGWDLPFTGRQSFKQWALQQGDYDLSRFVFLGQIDPEQLAWVLAASDLHFFLSVPFIPSWSLFHALGCACVVLGSDVAPVREVIESGVNGLLEPLFDVDRLVATALGVLHDPAAFRPLGQAARARMEERYSLDVAVPALKGYFERRASGG
jgi:glycosyltransferase involved in cell wall biosynthesis